MITLEHQDHSAWSSDKIKEGTALLQNCLPKGRPGPYQIQAAISGVHAHSADWESTDWAQIVELYGVLLQFEPTPVVQLNQAVAMCMSGNAEMALTVLEGLENMSDYAPFYLAQAEVFGRLGRRHDAKNALSLALENTQNTAEATFIREKLGYLH